MFFIALSIAAGQLCSAPVTNIPVFQDQRDNPDQRDRIPLPLDRIQVIIPAYTFTCHGRVVQWGACVERGGGRERYDIDFQVLRPSPVSDPGVDCYTLVGSNLIEDGRPDGGCIVYDVPVEEQFLVQPGDVVGFFSDHVNREDNNGVQVVESRQDVVVHYRERDAIPATDPESCMFVVGPGQIDLVTTGAPVITAVVGEEEIYTDHRSLAIMVTWCDINLYNSSICMTLLTYNLPRLHKITVLLQRSVATSVDCLAGYYMMPRSLRSTGHARAWYILIWLSIVK